jgi:hypothetical protein
VGRLFRKIAAENGSVRRAAALAMCVSFVRVIPDGSDGLCEASNAQDALMIGKTSRAVAMKYARPTTPKTANTAKDTFSTAKAPLGSWGCVFIFQTSKSTPVDVLFRLHSINFNSTPQTGENS